LAKATCPYPPSADAGELAKIRLTVNAIASIRILLGKKCASPLAEDDEEDDISGSPQCKVRVRKQTLIKLKTNWEN
jgi:hypothetical protein